jgi:hypothetical protein
MHIAKPGKKGLHQNWRTWLVVGFMLMAIGMYVLTLDDSIVPVSPSGGGGPVSASPSKP